MRLSWTLWLQRRRTRRLARQVERLKQELATLQVMAAERVERGMALERQLLPLLAGPEPKPENQMREELLQQLGRPTQVPPPPQLVLADRELTRPEPEPEPEMTPAELELAQRLGL